MKNAYEHRKEFLHFMDRTCQLKFSQESMRIFCITGFLPIEWLKTLFAHISTIDEYIYVIRIMRLMYAKKIDFTPSLRSGQQTLPKSSYTERQAAIPTILNDVASHQDPTEHSAKDDSVLRDMISRILDAVCDVSLHPSGFGVDTTVLEKNLIRILPNHALVVDHKNKKCCVVNASGIRCTIDLPSQFRYIPS